MGDRKDKRFGPGTPFRDRGEYERYTSGEFDPRYRSDWLGPFGYAIVAVLLALLLLMAVIPFAQGATFWTALSGHCPQASNLARAVFGRQRIAHVTIISMLRPPVSIYSNGVMTLEIQLRRRSAESPYFCATNWRLVQET